MRYHGNYCGPNWSAGRHQASVVSDVAALDALDELCQRHDSVYARSVAADVLNQADYEFYNSVIHNPSLRYSLKARTAAEILRFQRLLRKIMQAIPSNRNAGNSVDRVLHKQPAFNPRNRNVRETYISPGPQQDDKPKTLSQTKTGTNPTSKKTSFRPAKDKSETRTQSVTQPEVEDELAEVSGNVLATGSSYDAPVKPGITIAGSDPAGGLGPVVEFLPPMKNTPTDISTVAYAFPMAKRNSTSRTPTSRRARKPTPNSRRPNVRTIAAPVAMGSQLAGTRPNTRLAKDSVRVVGQDLLGSVSGPTGSTNPELGFKWSINPCYLASGSLSMYNPFYDEYRFNRLTITYITKMPTSTNGEIFISVTDNPNTNLYDINNSNFVAKFMTSQNARMGPIWQSLTVNWSPAERTFKKVNPITDAAPTDSTYGDFVAYVQGTTGAVGIGYFVVDYDIVYRKKRFTSQATMLSELYPTLQTTVSEANILSPAQTAHRAGDAVTIILNDASFASATGTKYGAVYEALYDSASAFPSVWATTVITGGNRTNLTISPGVKFYFLVMSSAGGNYVAYVYTNYPSAISAGADFLVWNDTGAFQVGIPFQITQVFASILRMTTAV